MQLFSQDVIKLNAFGHKNPVKNPSIALIIIITTGSIKIIEIIIAITPIVCEIMSVFLIPNFSVTFLPKNGPMIYAMAPTDEIVPTSLEVKLYSNIRIFGRAREYIAKKKVLRKHIAKRGKNR